MSGFDWGAHETVNPSKFDWDSHETVGHDSLVPDTNASIGQTALEHFGNGAALGYIPHLQAATEMGVNALGEAKDKALDMVGLDHLASIDHQLREQGFKLPDESYLAARDANIKRLAKEKKDNPITAGAAGIGGSIATGIATTPLMPARAATVAARLKDAATIGAATGIAANPGDNEGELAPIQLEDRAKNGLIGAGAGLATQGAVESVAKAAPFLSDNARKAGLYLQNKAEKAAVNATGATGKQASQFGDDAGRELLDRGVVRFGDSQAKIAKRAAAAVESANGQIDQALSKLDAQGVSVDGDQVRRSLQDKIEKMGSDPSKSDIARLLQNEVEHLDNATTAKSSTGFGMQEAESIKRGYNRKAGNWADPEKSQAGKEAYQTYRGAVEDAAREADPATAKLFDEGKKSYGLLAPIQEAAERRAATTSQSPAGGLLDSAAAIGGFGAGGAPGALAAPIARRVIAPRISSTIAASADTASKFLLKSPQFANLAEKNPQAFSALAANFARKVNPGGAVSKVAGPDQQPVDEDKAKQSFVEGN